MSWLQALRDALPADEDREGVHHSPPPPARTPDSAPTRGNRGSNRPRESLREPPTVNPPDPVEDAWYSRRRVIWSTPGGDVVDATTLLIGDPRHPGEVTTPYVLVACGWDRDDVLALIEPTEPDEDDDEDDDEDEEPRERMALDERIRWLLKRIDEAPLDAPIVVNQLARVVREKFGGMSESTAKRLARTARDLHDQQDGDDDE